VTEVLQNTRYVLAFELICAAQAADIRGNARLGPKGRAWHARCVNTFRIWIGMWR
jgi:histidine ammonia-lyase